MKLYFSQTPEEPVKMDNSPEKRDQPTTEKLMAVFSQAYYGRNEEVFKQLRDALAPKDPILAAATFADWVLLANYRVIIYVLPTWFTRP